MSMYYTLTFINTHCPQSLHTILCSITKLQQKPSCSSLAPKLQVKSSAPQVCSITRQQKKHTSIMLEPMHPNFPQQCIQSQDNKKRPHAGGHAPRLSTEQSFQMQDNKWKHHAPAHAFFINQIFLLSNGAWQPFSWQFWHSYFIFRNIETLSPKLNLKKQKKLWKKIKENSGNFHFQSNIFKIK